MVDYFEDYLGVLNDLENGCFIFTGRKGVGKSAIAKYIKDQSDKSENSYATLLREMDLNMERVRLIKSEEQRDDLVPLLFEWLILINIIALILESRDGVYTDEYKCLEKFYRSNFVSIEARQFKIVEKTIEKVGMINCEVLFSHGIQHR